MKKEVKALEANYQEVLQKNQFMEVKLEGLSQTKENMLKLRSAESEELYMVNDELEKKNQQLEQDVKELKVEIQRMWKKLENPQQYQMDLIKEISDYEDQMKLLSQKKKKLNDTIIP